MLIKVIVTTAVTLLIGGAGAAIATVDTHTQVAASSSGYSKDQCKHGGWKDLGFKNQGQCIKFFNHV